jgi:hypothetical protein
MIESEGSVTVCTDSLRCFIYTYGGDGFSNEVAKHTFAYENVEKSPFQPVKKKISRF